MSYNGYYPQESYNYPYTANYDQTFDLGYTDSYLKTSSPEYASVPMQPSTSGSSMGSRGSHNSINSYNSNHPYPSSPDEYYDSQAISPIPLAKIDVHYTAPVNTSMKGTNKHRNSSSSSSPKSGILHCLHGDCEYQTKRQYDLDRHQRIHFPSQPGEKFDCPGRGCGRTGEHGFDRKDHLREHLRKVHAKDIPKQNRRGSKSPQ